MDINMYQGEQFTQKKICDTTAENKLIPLRIIFQLPGGEYVFTNYFEYI